MGKDDIVIATREEAIWIKVKDEAEQLIKNFEDSLIIQREVLELAKKKIEEEQKK